MIIIIIVIYYEKAHLLNVNINKNQTKGVNEIITVK